MEGGWGVVQGTFGVVRRGGGGSLRFAGRRTDKHGLAMGHIRSALGYLRRLR